MKIKYANKSVQKFGMGDPAEFFYQFIYDKNDSDDKKMTQYFIMHGLELCIKVYSYVAHMFYEWLFSHNTPVPISIKKKTYFLSLNTYTTVFACGAGNYNKNRT